MGLIINQEYAISIRGKVFLGTYKGPNNYNGIYFDMPDETIFVKDLNGFVGFGFSEEEFIKVCMIIPTTDISGIVDARTKEERFYDWMQKIGSIHLANNEKMSKAFSKIIV